MREIPTISASNYTSTVMPVNLAMARSNTAWSPPTTTLWFEEGQQTSDAAVFRRVTPLGQFAQEQETSMATPKPSRRIVKVFIADTDENVPMEQSIIYTGPEKLTDATDQELFFEVDIAGLLKTHNEKRVQIVNKSIKERTEHLEPARIRDLKMVVVTIATF